MGFVLKIYKRVVQTDCFSPTNNCTPNDHVAETSHKIDPTINIVEMGPKIYWVPSSDPTTQRGKEKDDKAFLPPS